MLAFKQKVFTCCSLPAQGDQLIPGLQDLSPFTRMLSSLAQNGSAMACPLVQRFLRVLDAQDFAVADLVPAAPLSAGYGGSNAGSL